MSANLWETGAHRAGRDPILLNRQHQGGLDGATRFNRGGLEWNSGEFDVPRDNSHGFFEAPAIQASLFSDENQSVPYIFRIDSEEGVKVDLQSFCRARQLIQANQRDIWQRGDFAGCKVNFLDMALPRECTEIP